MSGGAEPIATLLKPPTASYQSQLIRAALNVPSENYGIHYKPTLPMKHAKINLNQLSTSTMHPKIYYHVILNCSPPTLLGLPLLLGVLSSILEEEDY